MHESGNTTAPAERAFGFPRASRMRGKHIAHYNRIRLLERVVLAMRIAQIAPLYESVPPKLYGGTERVVSYLTEELVRQGHDVTLFASGDSRTPCKLVPCCDIALRLNPAIRDPLPYHIIMLEQLRQRAREFDVLHFHIDYLHAPLVRSMGVPTITTHHGRLDLPDLCPFYAVFREIPLVAISDDQRRHLRQVNWVATVHHGLPSTLLPFSAGGGGYLAFLGRISPEKGPDRAIEIAAKAGLPLKIAAKIDRVDQAFWDEKIRPMIETCPNVEFIGEIDERQKARFLGEAAALLFPIDWPEPFGLVMIEAMACGTPVIAFRRGSVPEIIEDGVTGFVVDTVDQAASAVMRIGEIDRKQVRAAFERRFSAARMARDYVELYRAVTSRHPESIKIQPIKSKAYAATTTGAVSDRSTIPNIPADKAAVYSALQHERRAIRRTKNKGSRLIDGHLLGSRGSAAPSMNAP